MATWADIKKNVDDMLQDKDDVVSETAMNRHIDTALTFHNKNKPRTVIGDISGDGSYDYDLPADYEADFSVIYSVEYPAGERIPTYLEDEDWMIYRSATATYKLRFLNDTPNATETIRIEYSIRWTYGNITSLPVNDVKPFAYLVAALAAAAISLYYAQSGDGTVDVDVVDYEDKSSLYSKRSRELFAQYKAYFGITKNVKGYSTYIETDRRFHWGEAFFLHGGSGY